MGESKPIGKVVRGDQRCDGHAVLYVLKADPTNYINYMKPLILAEELRLPHVLAVIDTKDQWYYAVHPERYVPALKDRDPKSGKEFYVFESTGCLQYLAEQYDVKGLWKGRTAQEKGCVLSWTAYQTAGLGPTAKYWLYFSGGYPSRASPVILPRTIEKLHANWLQQWDILDKRLALPGQQYIALPDRPTIADLSYLPFCMPVMCDFIRVDFARWPHLRAWAERMLARPAVATILAKAPTLGHES